MNTCEVCGRTSNEYDIVRYKGMLLCRKHVSQYCRHGKFFTKTIYDNNDYIIYQDYAEIILLNKNNTIVGTAIIDIEDIELCKCYKWHIKKGANTNYAIATISEHSKIFMHRLILNYDGNMDIDHIDHNGLNNKRSNLEICSHSKNLINQYKKYNGVKRVKSGKYTAQICIDAKTIHLGTYDTADEALNARKLKEVQLFG